MKLIPIHYNVSKPVTDFEQVAEDAWLMAEMIDAKEFKGLYSSCYALAHAQVKTVPLSFFVLDPQLVKGLGDDESVAVFEERVIINPQIIEAPIYLEENSLLKRIFTGKKFEETTEVSTGKKPNSGQFMEACMSFPHRKTKKITRFNKIKVSYQTKGRGRNGMKKHTAWLEGLASQVFQHEFDHCEGKNIFFTGFKD